MTRLLTLFLTLAIFSTGFCNDEHTINFNAVKASELVRFISKVTKSNFLFNDKDLDFEVSFICGKASSEHEILESLVTLLDHHKFRVKGKKGNYVIEKKGDQATSTPLFAPRKDEAFCVYKLQFHKGDEILTAVKELAATNLSDQEFVSAVNSMQWLKSTNSLVFSSSEACSQKVLELVRTLDTPQKQVFIEVLVIETDINKSHEFGLNWSSNAKYKDKFGITLGGVNSNTERGKEFAGAFSKGKFPSSKGFDLGVIGDLICHKGATFLSLGSLVTAVQGDHDSSVVLNQKIIAQDNKTSTIFDGRNIPFAGAVVKTVGQTEQTTANIEYKDVGTSLNITPYIGEKGMITLEIDEEISNANEKEINDSERVNGVETSKTNMSTRVHVPDGHFLALTGMASNRKKYAHHQVPCLGGLPVVGSLFGNKKKSSEKKSLLIFVRPHIINTFEEYEALTNGELDTLKESLTDEEMINDIVLTPQK